MATPPRKRPVNPNASTQYRQRSGKPALATEATAVYHSAPDPILALDVDALPTLAPLLADDTGLADDDTDHPITSRQAALLSAYVRWTTASAPGATGEPITDALLLCESVGYHPADLSQAQALLSVILGRIEAIEDTKRISRLMGMGVPRWLRKVYQIAHCGSPRVEVIAAKLWGLANGVFDDPVSGSGAKVIIEAATQSADGSQAGVRVTLDSRGSPPTSGQELVFSARPPRVTQKRHKMLKKLD